MGLLSWILCKPMPQRLSAEGLPHTIARYAYTIRASPRWEWESQWLSNTRIECAFLRSPSLHHSTRTGSVRVA